MGVLRGQTDGKRAQAVWGQRFASQIRRQGCLFAALTSWNCLPAYFQSQSSRARRKGKIARAEILSSLPCSRPISLGKPRKVCRRKGETKAQEELAQCFIAHAPVSPRGKHSTRGIENHGPSPSSPLNPRLQLSEVSPVILSLILYFVTSQAAGKVQRVWANHWQKSPNSSS